MPELRDLPRRVMRGGAGFNADKARSLLLKERQDLAAPQLPAHNSSARRINTVDLTFFARSRPIVVTSFMDGSPLAVPQQQPQFGTSMPVAGAVHSIMNGHTGEALSLVRGSSTRGIVAMERTPS